MQTNQVTIKLNRDIITKAYRIAEQRGDRIEDILAEWLDSYVYDLPVESLPDEEIIALCRFRMDLLQHQELSNLLYVHRERPLDIEESARLDELLQLHRRHLVRKAQALEVAVKRGLDID